MTSIYLPQLVFPNGNEATVQLKVALVDSVNRQPVFGFEGLLSGYAGESTFQLNGSSEALELPPNNDLVPGSLWRFTLEMGAQSEIHYIDLEDASEVALADLLYAGSS